jgi:hypothetical protein
MNVRKSRIELSANRRLSAIALLPQAQARSLISIEKYNPGPLQRANDCLHVRGMRHMPSVFKVAECREANPRLSRELVARPSDHRSCCSTLAGSNCGHAGSLQQKPSKSILVLTGHLKSIIIIELTVCESVATTLADLTTTRYVENGIMADSENSPACALRNAQIEVKTFLYELRVLFEGLAHGVKSLIGNPAALPVKSELGVLESFIDQGVEAFDGYKQSTDRLLSWPAEPTAD